MVDASFSTPLLHHSMRGSRHSQQLHPPTHSMRDQDIGSTAANEASHGFREQGRSPGEVDADDLLRLQRVVGPPSSVLGPVTRHEARHLDESLSILCICHCQASLVAIDIRLTSIAPPEMQNKQSIRRCTSIFKLRYLSLFPTLNVSRLFAVC